MHKKLDSEHLKLGKCRFSKKINKDSSISNNNKCSNILAQTYNVTSRTTNRIKTQNYKKYTKTKTLFRKHNHPNRIQILHLQMCLPHTLNELKYRKGSPMNSKFPSTISLIRQV